jgi:all-trans-8'-apo-beta-carotenal 15,15'-oxygenase
VGAKSEIMHAAEDPEGGAERRETDALAASAYRTLEREHGFEPLLVEGALPPELRGTLYFDGPACFEQGGRPYVHWFDGDGAITAVRLADGEARGAVRFVEGPQLRRERAMGRALYSSGATRGPSLLRRLGGRTKNTANINTIVCDGRLLALGDAYPPIEIDREDLRARGETDLRGTVRASLGAHYRSVASSGRRYGMALQYGRKTVLRLLELPERAAPREVTRLELAPGTVMLHDLAVTERHLLLFVAPVRLSVLPFILGVRAPLEALRWRPDDGSEVVVIPFERPHRPVRFTIPAFFHFHFVNAFDDGDEIVADLVRYPDFSIFDHLRFDRRFSTAPDRRPHGVVERARVHPEREWVRFETVSSWPAEFPRVVPHVSGRRHRHAWMIGRPEASRLPTLCRLDCEDGSMHPTPLGDRRVTGEGVPIPKGEGELEAWVATLVYDVDTDRSHLALVDGARPEAGAVTRIWFDQRIPPPLHGNWVVAS